ncbi:hypothetical protein RN001_012409 [Aquatica leii]|uniref:Uncharacterized protein n=1 Tax=Aquatica leii TaxID=1421715 RepID=A0AAN7SDA4_9COLE|nr:hypothetical protein RN001_012409 [Aquatica leii]
MKIYQQLCSFMAVLFVFPNTGSSYSCNIPVILQGTWFSRENGRNTFTELDATSMSRRGRCLAMKEEFHVNYTLIFKQDLCYTCVKFLVRTVNVLEKIETPCVDAPEDHVSIDTICHSSNSSQQLVTLFSENYVPVNCRSSLHGVWNFAYQNKFKFTGECKHPDSYIRSCEQPDSQFLKTNQRFNITYKKCTGMTGSFDGVVEYSCLGDWFLGKNHYFAVANTKESRRDEKYRCFLKNLDSDLYLGVSTTADCSTLNTVENSPERLHIKPVQPEIIEPGCRLPQNFSGNWINTANMDADIFINETHIIETWNYDNGRSSNTTYVCKEQHDSLVMMARLTIGSCQKEYVCFDFVLQHHNIVRYRKGTPMITDNFHTVCSKMQFQNQVKSKYELYLRKNPMHFDDGSNL